MLAYDQSIKDKQIKQRRLGKSRRRLGILK
jgi:hypothetical protein